MHRRWQQTDQVDGARVAGDEAEPTLFFNPRLYLEPSCRGHRLPCRREPHSAACLARSARCPRRVHSGCGVPAPRPLPPARRLVGRISPAAVIGSATGGRRGVRCNGGSSLDHPRTLLVRPAADCTRTGISPLPQGSGYPGASLAPKLALFAGFMVLLLSLSTAGIGDDRVFSRRRLDACARAAAGDRGDRRGPALRRRFREVLYRRPIGYARCSFIGTSIGKSRDWRKR